MGRFPDCELGAMPPFGNLYDIPVYIDKSLCARPEIAFNAGTHRELIKRPPTISRKAGESDRDGPRDGVR